MMIIIPLYGIQVCPFIEKLNPLEIFATIDSLLLLAYLLRPPLLTRMVDTLPLAGQAWRVFTLDIGIFVAAGLILSGYNHVVHDFPLASGLKVMVGIIAMGLFASTDFALERERHIAKKVEHEGLILEISGDFFPLTSKLALYAGAFVLLVVAVFSLLVIKDLDWLVNVGSTVSLHDARISILKEFGFILIVVMFEAINIILSFTRNLNMFLKLENGVLAKVTSGLYDTQVPISSNDEFGVMAVHTNEMIKRICERTDELNRTRDVTILTLASLAETRDNETGAQARISCARNAMSGHWHSSCKTTHGFPARLMIKLLICCINRRHCMISARSVFLMPYYSNPAS
jgi:hypothetical protein